MQTAFSQGNTGPTTLQWKVFTVDLFFFILFLFKTEGELLSPRSVLGKLSCKKIIRLNLFDFGIGHLIFHNGLEILFGKFDTFWVRIVSNDISAKP